MRDIYSLSSGNLIFLDVDLKQAAISVALFGRLWREAAAFTDEFRGMELIIGRRAPSRRVLNEADSAAFFAMVFSSWFRRVWVMQEAALAPSSTCYIGDGHVSLIDLLRAFRWREYKYYYAADTGVDSTSVNTALRNILTLWRYVDPTHGPYRKAQGAAIADALVFARGLNSSQPRDHVFGFLGLIRYRSLSASIMGKLRPSYSRSILDIFRDATVAALLELGGIPDLIFEEIIHRHYNASAPDKDSWPSWVPNWSLPRDLEDHPGRLNKWYFAASGQEPFDFAEVNDTTIQVRGVVVDEVTRVTEICRVRDWHGDGNMERLISWLKDVDNAAGQEDHDPPTRSAINTVLLAGLNGEGRPVTEQDLNTFGVGRQTLDINGKVDASSSRINEVFERTCNNRRFFSTYQGLIGIGPNILLPGDKIVVIYGCRAPIVLRAYDGASYHVVGECYIQDLMYGEALHMEVGSEILYLR